MLKRLDNSLLKLHQWVLDQTQKPQRWCAMQAAILNFILICLYNYLDKDLSLVVGVFQGCVGLVYARFVPVGSFVTALVRVPLLCVCLAFNLLDAILFLYGKHPGSLLVLGIIEDCTYLAIFYFLSCEPPRPKKVKQTVGKLALNGSAS